MEDTDPTVREVLRVGAYQLLYMDRVPEYAVVSESVEQVREEVGRGPTGFVNAVLRKVAESGDGPDRFPDPDATPLDHLETWGSHPRWLLDRWAARLDLERVRALVAANNRRPETCLVPLKGTPEALVDALGVADIDADVVGEASDCVRLRASSSVSEALAVAGPAVVQDPAANLVVRYANVPLGTMVADLCAAPGGKALVLSTKARRVLAADRSEQRIRMVQQNVERTGQRHVSAVVADALHPPVRDADVVLLDVPCTGTGTLARHPDARWRLAPDDPASLAATQSALLSATADSVRPGGLLVYSTCTLESEENEGVVGRFLANRSDFELEPCNDEVRERVDEEGYLRVWPDKSGFDGAFAARMRKAT